MYTYIYTFIHTYIYIFICIYIFIYIYIYLCIVGAVCFESFLSQGEVVSDAFYKCHSARVFLKSGGEPRDLSLAHWRALDEYMYSDAADLMTLEPMFVDGRLVENSVFFFTRNGVLKVGSLDAYEKFKDQSLRAGAQRGREWADATPIEGPLYLLKVGHLYTCINTYIFKYISIYMCVYLLL